jgi:hypothetical protein
MQTLRRNTRPAQELAAGDGQVVVMAGVEHHGEPRRSRIPLRDFFDPKAHPGDDLERLDAHGLAWRRFCASFSGVRQAVEEFHASRKSAFKMLWAEGLDFFGLPGRDFTGTNDGQVAFAAGDLVLMNRAAEFGLGAGDADALVPVVTDPPAMIVPGLEEFRKIVPECLLGPQDARRYAAGVFGGHG